MAEYKKQHYLPASYLKYFSEDQSNCCRDSLVWQFDGRHTRRVPVVSQGFKKYFYSKRKAVDTERMFSKRENIYCEFADKIRAGQESQIQNYGDLFLCMCDLHIRNAAHNDFIDREGVDAYDDRLSFFFGGLLMGNVNGDLSIENIKQHLQSNWRVEIISTPGNVQFFTSDHPVIFMTFSNPPDPSNPLQIILLALDPSNIAVGFDRRFVSVEKKKATIEDVGLFNINQVHNATKFIYSSSQVAGNNLSFFRGVFLRKKSPLSEINLNGWKLSLTYLSPQNHYSFIRMEPRKTVGGVC
jgi:hypothetical protein